jgi:hypothetical protein
LYYNLYPAIVKFDAGVNSRAVTRFGFTPLELAPGWHLVELQQETAKLIRERIAAEEEKCMIVMLFLADQRSNERGVVVAVQCTQYFGRPQEYTEIC